MPRCHDVVASFVACFVVSIIDKVRDKGERRTRHAGVETRLLPCIIPWICLTLLVPAVAEPLVVNRELYPPLPPPGTQAMLRAVPTGGRIRKESVSAHCTLLRQGQACRAFGTIDPPSQGSLALSLELVHPDGARSSITLGSQAGARGTLFDVVLLLDASESMKKTDPKDLRLDAVRTFLDLARHSRSVRRIALVSFREKTEVILPFCEPGAATGLEERLRKLRPRGATNMDAAFATAAELLAEEKRPPGVLPAVVFLSDGKPSVLRKYRNGHEALAPYNCPAYTVALSDLADADLLDAIAAQTRGRFLKAHTARELQSIFTHVFGIIVRLRSVYEQDVVCRNTETLPLCFDPTMKGSILACASRGAPFRLRVGDKIEATLPGGDLRFLPLQGLPAGSHPLTVEGTGRLALRLSSNTPLHLELVPLNRQCDRGIPILCYAYLSAPASANLDRLSASVRGPDGKALETVVAPHSSMDGLLALRCNATDAEGPYRLTAEAHGNSGGMPFVRRRVVTFLRQGAAAPEFDMGAPVRGAQPAVPDDGFQRTLRPQPGTSFASGTRAPLRTTLQCSPSRVLFDDLWPGTSASKTIRIRLHGEGVGQPAVALLGGTGTEAVRLTVEGHIDPDRESVLALQATPTEGSAGQSWSRPLQITAGGRSWEIPVQGAVQVPRIVATLSGTQLDHNESARELRAVTQLHVHVEPHGRCRLRVATEIDAGTLTASRPELVAGQDPVPIELDLSGTRTPDRDTQWTGRVTVTGDGLNPAVLPYRLAVPAKAAARPGDAGQQQRFPLDPRLVRTLLLALAILLLVLLVIAMVRRQQRTVFLCASALLHLAALFLVLPASEIPGPTETAAGTPAVLPGAAVTVTQVPAERSDKSGVQSSQPEHVPQDPEARSEDPAIADASRRMEPPEAEQAPEAPDVRDADTGVPRARTDTADVPAPVAPDQRRRAAEERMTREAEPAAAAEALMRPRPAEPRSARTVQPETVAAAASPASPRSVARSRRPQIETRILSEHVATPQGRKAEDVSGHRPRAERGPLVVRIPESSSPRTRDTARTATVRRAAAAPGRRVVPRPAETAPALKRHRTVVRPPADSPVAAGAERRRATGKTRAATPDASPSHSVLQSSFGGADFGSQTVEPMTIALSRSVPEATTAPLLPRPRARETPAEVEPQRPPPAGKRQSVPTRAARSPEQVSRTRALSTQARPDAVRSRSRAVNLPSTEAPQMPGPVSLPPARLLPLRRDPRPPTAEPAEPSMPRPAFEKKAGKAGTGEPVRDASFADAAGFIMGPAGGAPMSPASRLIETRPTDLSAPPRGDVPAIAAPWREVEPADLTLAEFDRGQEERPRRTSAPAPQRGSPHAGAPPEPHAAPLLSRVEQRDAARPLAPDRDRLILAPDAQLPGRSPIGIRHESAVRSSGRSPWRHRFAFVILSDGDRSDRTAMINLAHQFETRTGSPMPYSGMEIEWTSQELKRAPFLFISGHDDFRLDGRTVSVLREYLEDGGSLWLNDSTDIGNEVFDRAVRREMQAVLPDTTWEKIPRSAPLFRSPYDLRKGYRGYAVPPGDKYRVDYIEGIQIGSRFAVIYTRNDYGDGLEIDAHTHPLMASLTDLSPREMQEGSIRMGINIVTYFLTAGRATGFRMTSELVRRVRSRSQDPVNRWAGKPQTPMPLPPGTERWEPPEGWTDLMEAQPGSVADGLAVTFRQPAGVAFRQRLHKAVTTAELSMNLTPRHAVLVDVESRLASGARIALGFTLRDAPQYIETAPVFVRPGMNRNVVFDLGTGNLKTEQTQWAYKAAFPENAVVQRIYLVILPQQPRGTVVFRGFRTVR